jgi:hypothetical protein
MHYVESFERLRKEIAEELAALIKERIAADLVRYNEKVAEQLAQSTEIIAQQLAAKHLKWYLSILALNLMILALLILR